MKKVSLLVDSSMGLTKKEANEIGLNFVPIIASLNGKDYESGIDIDMQWLIDNLKKDSDFKTAACKPSDLIEAYKRGLKESEHVLYVPISKHLSSTIETAKMIANEDEFKGKVTVYDSEFIGPWLLQFKNLLKNMISKDASLEEFNEVFDSQKNEMIGWVCPKNLDRLYHSGRLSRAKYLSGSLLKITPIIEIKNGSLNNGEVIKARSKDKAIKIIVEKTIERKKQLEDLGKNTKVVVVTLGIENELYDQMKKSFNDYGINEIFSLSLPTEILGHVGIGGIGGGCIIDIGEEYKPKK